jgi:hypothetical protein
MELLLPLSAALVSSSEYAGLQRRSLPAGVLYTLCTFMGMVNLMSSMPVVSQERAVFYRSAPTHVWSAGLCLPQHCLPYDR